MRPRLETARDQLPALLRRSAGTRAKDLAKLAQVSPATMLRVLTEAGASVVRVGRTSATRYYLRRALRGLNTPIPVYAVDVEGGALQVGELHLIAPNGTVLDVAAMGWPVDKEFALGVWPDGLPYPLQDMRPQGFLGRQFALHESTALGVPANPKDWDDDAVLHVLLQRGVDTPGNLILGDTALQLWLRSKAAPPEVLTQETIGPGYAQAAALASARGAAGSSAGGEFPKFTALRDLPGAQTQHVIVKYTADDRSDTVQRWSDLLVCEHLALQALRTVDGLSCANSRIVQEGGRTYLEIERFDRHGLYGRSPLCSLEAIEASQLPSTSGNWGAAADMLHACGWITSAAVQMVKTIWAFGRLIGNSDMHRGNLSFVPASMMQVAPVYDMLPMMFAPLQGGEIPSVSFAPELPMPADKPAWDQASKAAQAFWLSASQDFRISAPFRTLCDDKLKVLDRLMALA